MSWLKFVKHFRIKIDYILYINIYIHLLWKKAAMQMDQLTIFDKGIFCRFRKNTQCTQSAALAGYKPCYTKRFFIYGKATQYWPWGTNKVLTRHTSKQTKNPHLYRCLTFIQIHINRYQIITFCVFIVTSSNIYILYKCDSYILQGTTLTTLLMI